MAEPSQCKAQPRQDMRQQRRALGPNAQFAAARAVTTYISGLPGWSKFRRIALYLANDGEIETTSLSELCRSEGKQLYLPVIDEQNLLAFAAWDKDDELVSNRFGIAEPSPEAERCSVSALDIVILPLVAWDHQGGDWVWEAASTIGPWPALAVQYWSALRTHCNKYPACPLSRGIFRLISQ